MHCAPRTMDHDVAAAAAAAAVATAAVAVLAVLGACHSVQSSDSRLGW